MMRITTEIAVFGGRATHYLVVRIPIRDGRPLERHLPPPLVAGFELETRPVIESLRSVATRVERRQIDQAVAKIVGEDGAA